MIPVGLCSHERAEYMMRSAAVAGGAIYVACPPVPGLATGPIRVVAPPCGSGTYEIGIDDRGRRWERVYGEMHGRTFGGAERCHVVRGPWKPRC